MAIVDEITLESNRNFRQCQVVVGIFQVFPLNYL